MFLYVSGEQTELWYHINAKTFATKNQAEDSLQVDRHRPVMHLHEDSC